MELEFFENKEQRDLWLRLNAEFMRYRDNKLNEDLGNVKKRNSFMWISNNQLDNDECNRKRLRFTLEELSTLQHSELKEIDDIRELSRPKREFIDYSEKYDNLPF